MIAAETTLGLYVAGPQPTKRLFFHELPMAACRSVAFFAMSSSGAKPAGGMMRERRSVQNTGSPDVYADNWDRYVEENFRRNFDRLKETRPDIQWPGDEWGTPQLWNRLFERLIASQFPDGMEAVLEIGPGSGKYTILIMDRFPGARVLGCDVSAAFLAVLKERCASYVEKGQLFPELIRPSETALTSVCQRHGLEGKLDAVISIDAMVHVDLHYLVSYWLEARQLLRQGGKIIMTVADATSEGGTAKLLRDIPVYFRDPRMQGKFEWISPDVVTTVLERMGFTVKLERAQRDCGFVATKL